MMYKAAPVFLLAFLFVPIFSAQGLPCNNTGAGGQPPCSPLGIIDQPIDAGVTVTDPFSGMKSSLSPATIPGVIINLLNWFSWFIAVIAVVMGVYSGFLFITARGEPAQLATAQKTILWAIIGIAVAILSFSIIAVTKAFIG